MLTDVSFSELPFQHPMYKTLSKDRLAIESPDKHFQWLKQGHIMARASIWIKKGDFYKSKPTVVIGHFEFSNLNSGIALLISLKNYLFDLDYSQIIGPMNGSSWFSYRLPLKPMLEPAFKNEPWHPPEHIAAFDAAGFSQIEHYCSNLQNGVRILEPRLSSAQRRLGKRGIRIESFSKENIDSVLPAVFKLCCEAFSKNPFYQPINFETFAALYQNTLLKIPEGYSQLAYHNDELIGFLFSYPDGSNLIVKTVAVKAGKIYAGLSLVLMDRLTQSVPHEQFKKVVYALIHTSNKSRNTADKFGVEFRRYAMMGIIR